MKWGKLGSKLRCFSGWHLEWHHLKRLVSLDPMRRLSAVVGADAGLSGFVSLREDKVLFWGDWGP